MAQRYWLVKQEPEDYAWSQFVSDGRTAWTGIRNFQARNHLRGMGEGDLVAFYHSGDAKEVVGWARVVRTAYADPTAEAGDWSAVDLVPVRPLKRPVTLAEIRADAALQGMALLRQSRLSVTELSKAEYDRICELGAATASR